MQEAIPRIYQRDDHPKAGIDKVRLRRAILSIGPSRGYANMRYASDNQNAHHLKNSHILKNEDDLRN